MCETRAKRSEKNDGWMVRGLKRKKRRGFRKSRMCVEWVMRRLKRKRGISG